MQSTTKSSQSSATILSPIWPANANSSAANIRGRFPRFCHDQYKPLRDPCLQTNILRQEIFEVNQRIRRNSYSDKPEAAKAATERGLNNLVVEDPINKKDT